MFSSILLIAPLTIQAQEVQEVQKTQEKKEKKNKRNKESKESEYKFFSFNGVGIQADLFGYIYPLIGEYTYAEGALELNIGNRLYPIAEIGYGWCNYTDETSGMHYNTASPYYKVGFNYNFFTIKPFSNNVS